ncbi:MAG: hypothetical protein ACYDGR_05790 [Candidatus Dormibacteria bacterium]
MKRTIVGILGLAAITAAASSCTATGQYVGIYGTIKTPDGKTAQVYASMYDPSAGGPSNYADGGPANVLVYTGDDCVPLGYSGDKNTHLTIAQDFSAATLKVNKTQWGELDLKFTAPGTQSVPVTVPAPKACPAVSANGVQQYMVATGRSGDATWSAGGATGTAPGLAGVMVYQGVYNNFLPGAANALLHANSSDRAASQAAAAPAVSGISAHPAAATYMTRAQVTTPAEPRSHLAHGMRAI